MVTHTSQLLQLPLSLWPTGVLLALLQGFTRQCHTNQVATHPPHIRSWRAFLVAVKCPPLPKLTIIDLAIWICLKTSPDTPPLLSASITQIRRQGVDIPPSHSLFAGLIANFRGSACRIILPNVLLPLMPSYSHCDFVAEALVHALQSLVQRNTLNRTQPGILESDTSPETSATVSGIERLGLHPCAHLPTAILHWNLSTLNPVSYTHLTLPTILRV